MIAKRFDGLAAGAAPAAAQTISAPPCAVNLGGPTVDSPEPPRAEGFVG